VTARSNKGYLQAIDNVVYRIIELGNEAEAAGIDPDEMIIRAYTDKEYATNWTQVDDIMEVIAETYDVDHDDVTEDVFGGVLVTTLKEIDALNKGL